MSLPVIAEGHAQRESVHQGRVHARGVVAAGARAGAARAGACVVTVAAGVREVPTGYGVAGTTAGAERERRGSTGYATVGARALRPIKITPRGAARQGRVRRRARREGCAPLHLEPRWHRHHGTYRRATGWAVYTERDYGVLAGTGTGVRASLHVYPQTGYATVGLFASGTASATSRRHLIGSVEHINIGVSPGILIRGIDHGQRGECKDLTAAG